MEIRDEWGIKREATIVSSPNAPYIEYEYKVREKRYNPNYGDNRVCVCGHSYQRHFDSYDNMRVVGCKYCRCDEFLEQPKSSNSSEIIRACRCCGRDTKDIQYGVCDDCAMEFEV